MSALVATRPIIAAKLTAVGDKNYHSGVLGLRAQPTWDGEAFTHDGVAVVVIGCPSTLAVWEALQTRDTEHWLVILTPVEEAELGIGVLAHLVDGRLLTPDPWDAVRSNFAASTLEPRLYRDVRNDRALAGGLLAVLPPATYLPAPGGVLTRDHALAAVARRALHMTDDPTVEIDALAVLEWSRQPGASQDFTRLRTDGGTELTNAFIEWLQDGCGRLGRPVSALLRTGRIAELVPLGLIAGLLDPDVAGGQRALGLFEGSYELGGLHTEELRAWYEGAAGLVLGPLAGPECQVVLDAAGRHVRELGITELAQRSELLPQGIALRLENLSREIDRALDEGHELRELENAWQQAQQHFLARTDTTCGAFATAVRLTRWLSQADTVATDLVGSTQRYVDVDAWVDSALAATRSGAAAPAPAATLRRVIELATARRRAHDQQFAAALADAPQPGIPVVENLLGEVVFPLARAQPTLLLVLDALSMAVATELVGDACEAGWYEAGVLGSSRRTGALAVLPTLTLRSRCSLLCGDLREGNSRAEHTGFVDATRAAGLGAKTGLPDPIFHKKALDSIPAGAALATDVANAVADTEGRPLVAAVLNYVDDTLHHTDPGGTKWTLDAITHLYPLLTAARSAGRAVLITSDHGHIIEHRDSTKRERTVMYGQRAHGDLDRVEDGEVLIRGPRVLTDSGAVVLAVEENIRYGPVNAGYHGGGTPAEVVVPIIALHTGLRPSVLSALDPVAPSWWDASAVAPRTEAIPSPKRKTTTDPSLFDVAEREPAPKKPILAEQVLATRVFADQKRLAGRIVVDEQQIGALLSALLAAPARELTRAQCSALLTVSAGRVNGALLQIKRVLDVEGYEVLLLTSDTVRVNEAALREQFEVNR